MKKVIFLVMILLVAFMMGCGSKVVVEQPSAPEAPAEPEPVEVPEPEEEEEPVIVEVAEDEDSGYDWDKIPKSEQREITSIRKAMDKLLLKEENYFYRYTGPDQYQYEYWIKGDKLKIQVLEQDELDKTTFKNMVYLDRSAKKAEWYCEHDNMNFCYSGKGPWAASYAEFNKVTPKGWLEELGKDFRYQFDDRINGISYSIIDYTIDDKLVRVWIDGWSGYPMQIDFHPDMDSESEPTETYLFDDPEIGVVKDSVVDA